MAKRRFDMPARILNTETVYSVNFIFFYVGPLGFSQKKVLPPLALSVFSRALMCDGYSKVPKTRSLYLFTCLPRTMKLT